MLTKLRYLLLLLMFFALQAVMGQTYNPNQQQQQQQQNPFYRDTTTRKPARVLTGDELMDSLRKKEDKKADSVIFTSKFIRVTNERLLSDSTQVFPLDTGLKNFENYSPLYQPRRPKIGLGSLGLAQRDLLFEPEKSIGFDVGQHYLDAYLFTPQDVQYYKARAPYTNLYLVTGGRTEQVFKATHTQNINPRLNVGFNFNLIGSNGLYNRQNVSDLNAAVFSWYESRSKRYNLLANAVFNNLKSPESGAILNQNIFVENSFSESTEPVRLASAKSQVKNNTFYIKQFYYIGRIDSTSRGVQAAKVLPTQRVTHTFYYNKQTYGFFQNEPDSYKVFPDYYYNATVSRDSLSLTDLHNEFSYSFYLRGKSLSFVKNEVKLDLALAQDVYHYAQYVSDSAYTSLGGFVQMDRKQERTFQNITLKARFSYKFSDKLLLEGNFQQIAQGYNAGDYLYDAKLTVAGGRKAGRIVFGAYTQNNTPPLVYTRWDSNHYRFFTDLNNQKITNASFNYINDPLGLELKAEYFLINNYLYFASPNGGQDAAPLNAGSPINLLKVSLAKNLTWRRWHFDNYLVYQKTDNRGILRTPEVYTYSNLYYSKLLFDVLNTSIGMAVRYNTTYVAPSYAVGLGQFYNGPDITFTSYPLATIYLKATLKSTNIFVMYDYANQGIFSKGFYTVNRYPMQSHLLKFGVSWNFYN